MELVRGALVNVTIGVLAGDIFVFVALGVEVEILGVGVALMTTGVAVNMDGVRVGGTNGVGALLGNG